MTTFGIGKLVLYANDPEALCAFYGAALGLSFERGEGTRQEARLPGGATLAIEGAPEPLPEGRRDIALVLHVEDLSASLERLRALGREPGPVREGKDGRSTALRDPEGRAVMLWSPLPVETAAFREPAPPPLVEPAAPEKPALIEPPSLVELQALAEKSASVPPPPLVEATTPEKPALVEPPAMVEKPALVEAPALIETPPLPLPETPPEMASRKTPPAPPPLFGTPGPLLSAIRPGKVDARGGVKLALFGANFAEDCQVLVDGVPCDARHVDAFTLEIIAPPHEAGSVDVAVENADGPRAVISVLYEEGPVIEKFTPAEGSPRGGTEIVIEGKNFQEGCMLTFFGSRSPAVVFESDKRVRFVVPPQDDLPFLGEIRLTNPDGLGCTAADLFGYRLATPRIASIAPAHGLVGGGKRIVVSGDDFHPQCVARIGGRPATANFKNTTTVELITPAAEAVGPADVEIQNPDGQVVRAEGGFVYEAPPAPPKLVEVRPDRGYLAGGLSIRLLGDNFDEDTIVRIGEVRAVARLVSRNELRVETPPRAEGGAVAIELVDRNGVVVRRDEAFTYEARPAPRVDSIAPRNGPMVGGTRVVIEGEFFPEDSVIRIGGQSPKRAVVRGGTIIELLMPPSRSPGFVDLEVGRPETGMTTVKNAYRYDPSPAPSVVSVAPNKGGVDGGTEVSIEGKNFVADAVVLFGGKPAARVKFVDATTLEVKTPPGQNGQMVDVVVKHPDGKEAVVQRAFQYDARYR
jgi:predicted enzyme related to lactoylglutathione lyase